MGQHKHYTIRAYHGQLSKKLEDALDYMACRREDNSYSWFYDGGLDNFAEKWPHIFAVYGDVIFVTQYNNFGQR